MALSNRRQGVIPPGYPFYHPRRLPAKAIYATVGELRAIVAAA